MPMNKQRRTGNILNIVSYDTSGNVTLPANIAAGTLHDAAYTRFVKPTGGTYVPAVSSATGAIAVTLPVAKSNSMLRVTIKVYEYTTNQSFEVHAGGYDYNNAGTQTWANNPYAYIIGNPGIDRRFNVRFGYNTSTDKAIIYIGELNTVWSYPQVWVTEIQVGFGGMNSSWLNACSVAFEASTFQNVSATISNAQVGYAVSTNTANAVVLRDGSGNFSAGAITAASLSATNVIASNFSDSTGSYNVNLGSGGNEGRGLVAGYSGSAYGGIGYNVRHSSSVTYIAPGSDTSSYLSFTNAGFAFYGAPAGTPGRTLTYSTLATLNSSGTFNAVNVTVNGNQSLHAANYNSYAPSLTGAGASGTWSINVTGSALRVVYNDGPRDLSDRLPNSFARTVNFDFVNAGIVGGTGNYGGVMSFHPWTGTTASTGDSSYQLAFLNETSINGAGLPGLRLRKGIDTTWGPWYSLLHAGNYNSYSPTLTGTGASGTWAISINGNAATATNLSTNRSNWVTNGTITAVVGQLAWRHYGNGHTIFDASGSLSPDGTAVSNTNPDVQWSVQYPTLMGWNGSQTYGVRVDTARNAGTVGGVAPSQIVYGDTGSRRGVNLISDWNQTTFPDAAFLSSENSSSNAPSTDFLYGVQMSFHRGGPDYRSQFVTSLYGNNVYYLRTRRDTQGWTSWVTLIHSSNYNSFAPTLTGTGASGTWGINITGTAAGETLATVTGRGATTATALSFTAGSASTSTTTGTVVVTGGVGVSGNIYAGGNVVAVAFFESSDIRLKNVIETNPNKRVDVDVIKFERKDVAGVRYGYSAQDVQKIAPELVVGDEFLSVNYLDVHTLKIAALEKEIRELKAKLGN